MKKSALATTLLARGLLGVDVVLLAGRSLLAAAFQIGRRMGRVKKILPKQLVDINHRDFRALHVWPCRQAMRVFPADMPGEEAMITGGRQVQQVAGRSGQNQR